MGMGFGDREEHKLVLDSREARDKAAKAQGAAAKVGGARGLSMCEL